MLFLVEPVKDPKKDKNMLSLDKIKVSLMYVISVAVKEFLKSVSI